MQRRAAATYAVFFLVLAVAAYAAIGVAQEPTVTVDDPAYSLSAGDTLTADDRTYTVGQVQAATNDGNDLRSASLSWVNESSRYTVTLEHNATVPAADVAWFGQAAQEEPYRLTVEDADDPSSFTLTQEFNVSGRLAEDPAVEDSTVTRADGERYVVYRDDGSTQRLSAYLPEPEERTFAEGELLSYQGNDTRVAAVTESGVTLAWTGARTNSLSLEQGATTTLGGTEYVAHFPDNSTLELTADREAYEDEVRAVETYHERVNGFWGISIISGLAAVFLLAVAYLPSRY